MRRLSSPAARYARKYVPLYDGGAFTTSGANWVAGQNITIPAGQIWILDSFTSPLGSLDIQGTLFVNPTKDVGITAASINVGANGTFQIGSEAQHYKKKATITLTGSENGRVTRYVADYSGQTGAGNGVIKRLSAGTGVDRAENYTLTFTSDTEFTVAGSSSGTLGSGTVGVIFNNKVRFLAVAGTVPWATGHTVTLTAEVRGFTNDGQGRSIQVQPGGKLILIGNPPTVHRTRINAHLSHKQQALTLAESVQWNKGDKIVVGPTDFFGTAQGASHKLHMKNTVAAAAAHAIGGVEGGRWGLLQYGTDSGLSLTPGTLTNTEGLTPEEWEQVPKVLDQRAPVINLTRNIVVQGVNDAAWQNNRFGAHVMAMGLSSTVQIDGVEFRRMGQAGAFGRYAFHWHMLSYNMPDGFGLPSDGTFLGSADPAKHYIRNSSIHDSSQRAIVIHGTHGVLVERNVCYDITAHAIFLEDGAEKNNTIRDNVVLKLRAPLSVNLLLDHDTETSGIWLSNPANILTGNWAADTVGNGIWNAFSARCFGLCYDVDETPQATVIGLHQDNVTFCAKRHGMRTENPALNNKGGTGVLMWFADSTNEYGDMESMKISRHTNYKTNAGYNNRVRTPFYLSWIQADNTDLDFHGSAGAPRFRGVGRHCFQVAESLNNSTSRKGIRNAYASYHEGLNFDKCVLIGYRNGAKVPPPAGSPTSGVRAPGMISLHDLYLGGIFRFNLVKQNRMIDSDFGVLIKSPSFDGLPITGISPNTGNTYYRNSIVCGALFDEGGSITGTPGKYLTFDLPFYTHELTDAVPSPADPETVITSTPYYGFGLRSVDGVEQPGAYGGFLHDMQVDRLDFVTGAVVASQIVPARVESPTITNMTTAHLRYFTFKKGAKYKVTHPTVTSSLWRGAFFEAAAGADDWVIVGFQWSNAVPVTSVWKSAEVYVSGPFNTSPALPSATMLSNNIAAMIGSVGSMTALEASSSSAFWQDTTSDTVWVKYVGGGIYQPTWDSEQEEDYRFKKRVALTIKA